ncbi:MAG: thioredoxin [Candidatus Pacearchaeota archaeon]|nr:thioredoxin [Candidatus Pacearchaeota archaeon]MDE1848709.1 thioredoxin [Nanoarchaeota archaeon]
MEEVPELTSKEFESFTKNGIVLIDFFADWCMPCLMMAPVVEELSEKFRGKIKFGKVNVDDYHELAHKFSVMSIPNFVLFRDGEKIGQFIGAMQSEDFEDKLKDIV